MFLIWHQTVVYAISSHVSLGGWSKKPCIEQTVEIILASQTNDCEVRTMQTTYYIVVI